MKVFVCLVMLVIGVTAEAQSVARRKGMEASVVSDALAAGWAALEAGRHAAAVKAADTVLQRRPHDHAAIVLKIQALASSGSVGSALDAYGTWAAAHRREDVHLLGVIAETVLRQIGQSAPEVLQRITALEALAKAGDTAAADALSKSAAAAGADGSVALAALGNERAAQALVAGLKVNPRPDAIRMVASVDAPGAEQALLLVLSNPDPESRSAAAEALGRLKSESAAPRLIGLLSDSSPAVRQSAAIALVALGRPEGEELVGKMLETGIPDIVLSVAEALPADAARWQAAVGPVLETENPVDRLRAARLMKDVAPDQARSALTAGLADPNLAVREEAARSLSQMGSTGTVVDWRRLLTDPSIWVRLEAARSIWVQVTQ